MFERPKSGQKAVLVHLDFNRWDYTEAHTEFVELARSAGADVLCVVGGKRDTPDPRYYLGSGKAESVRELVVEHCAEVVIVNHDLSPSQERNLERLLQARVLDRAGLILDIFAERARSHEGQLQVELAQLEHLSTRLVRGWSHLERQKGGIGLRGPGETQLETDRRLLAIRIKSLKKRLNTVRARRELGRQARRRADAPTVSLVGYTNAGKSTLFNALTEGGVYAADQLFATLDPTLRQLKLPTGDNVVLADTVGFIRDLPHELIAAFRATLEETEQANLLLHVVDAADEERGDRMRDVREVLLELGADSVPQLEVFNKIDLLDDDGAQDTTPRVVDGSNGLPARVYLSAQQGAGLDLLREAIARRLQPDLAELTVHLPPEAGRLRAALFERGAVHAERADDDGTQIIDLRIPRGQFDRLCQQAGLDPVALVRATTPPH